MKSFLISFVVLAFTICGLLGSATRGETVWINPDEGIGSGSLSVTGTGWKATSQWLNPPGYDFATNRYSLDLTSPGGTVALRGFADLSATAIANTGDWSKFYAKFSIRDTNGAVVNTVFGNDWLGDWHSIGPQPWDRLSLETENVTGFGSNTPHAKQYYCTEGGNHDMGGGGVVYPSTRKYFYQLIAEPTAGTFTLQAYGMGSSAPISTGWPAQNTLDYPTWLDIGSINVSGAFDFENVELYSILWASTQAGGGETSTISWQGMAVDSPLTFDQEPKLVPEPATMCLLGTGLVGLIGAAYRRKRRQG